MNLVFLTMAPIKEIESHNIYSDLMRKFRAEGHTVFIVSPRERRTGESTSLKENNGVFFLGVHTLNIQKANLIEKGIGQVLIESQFNRAIRSFLGKVVFDLILYATPPVTLTNVIAYLKKKNPQARTYLLLKDIFPQNAVDIGMMHKTGIRALLYRFFRNKEKRLYRLSDNIGCMSPANLRYVLQHNPELSPDKVEIAPNSYEQRSPIILSDKERNDIRKKYSLPLDLPIFIYGGNLGKPQGIPFLIKCLDANAERSDCHFLIVGNGTDYPFLNAWYQRRNPSAVSLFKWIPKEDYDMLVRGCDVGLVFLDYRFTIPNFPSRLLPYLMEMKPILAATDLSCDLGSIAMDNGFGLWCPSNSVDAFSNVVNQMIRSNLSQMGKKGYLFFLNNYTIEHTYRAIMRH